ncbi:MAG: hypothetical protein LIP00_06855 [Parabacteroides sp.]|nr:hypothetical protein [Parabacteroides sp.]
MHSLLRFLLSVLSGCLALPQAQASGLLFPRKSPPTRLDLFAGNRATFVNTVKIAFDICLPGNETFGQLFVYDARPAAYSFAYIGRDKTSSAFVLNSLSDKKNYLEIQLDPRTLGRGKWLRIETQFNCNENTIDVSVCGKRYRLENAPLANPSVADILFGGNRLSIVEAPLMILKNISVESNGAPLYFFPLSEAGGTEIREKDGKITGSVENPEWVINKQFYWETAGTFTSSAAAGVTFDPLTQQILVTGDTGIRRFDMNTLRLTEPDLYKCQGLQGYSGEAVRNPAKKETYFYNLADVAGKIRPFFSVIPDSGDCVQTYPEGTASPLHHHAFFYRPADSSVYIFGGYGNYTYSNRILRYDSGKRQWVTEQFTGDTIVPRMHTTAGNGPSPDAFFIFGGVGNETGRQELGKDFFCDLYLLDTRLKTIRKLWDTGFDGPLFVPARGIVYDSARDCLYVLCLDRTSTNLSLQRFDVHTGKRETVSDEIPFRTNCILSGAYLFEDKTNNELYAVTRMSEDNNPEARFTVYTLNAPPVTRAELGRNDPVASRPGTTLWLVGAGALCLLAGGLGATYRRKKQTPPAAPPEGDPLETETAPDTFPVKTNAVYLFGEFRVFGRNGKEITHRFSPKIKQLFVLLLLHSQTGGEGITTGRLSAMLWPDKTAASAKNSRGVTVNHLRGILSDLAGVELCFDEGKWKLSCTAELYCDYSEARRIARSLSDAGRPEPEAVRKLADLLKPGSLLPTFVSYEWFDKIKIGCDEYFVQVLEKLLPLPEIQSRPQEQLLLADRLFSFDRMNGTALEAKIKALKKLGRAEHAQTVSKRFRDEYARIYGEPYREGK